jgi:hypothetical protein
VNVNNAGVNAAASLAFLPGDVDGSRSITASDILRVKGRAGAVTGGTFLHDIDLSGLIDQADIDAVKQRSGTALP